MSTYPEGYPESEIIRAAQAKRAGALPRRWFDGKPHCIVDRATAYWPVGLIADAGRVDRSVLIFLNILWFMPLIWFPSQCGNTSERPEFSEPTAIFTDKSPRLSCGPRRLGFPDWFFAVLAIVASLGTLGQDLQWHTSSALQSNCSRRTVAAEPICARRHRAGYVSCWS